jgi:hypothetical protein
MKIMVSPCSMDKGNILGKYMPVRRYLNKLSSFTFVNIFITYCISEILIAFASTISLLFEELI